MARPGRPRKHDPLADEIRQAIEYGTMPEAVALIEKTDIDVLDGDSRTPLIHAASLGKIGLMSWLISNGADIDRQDRNGWCALHFAVQEKHADVVQFLLTNGAAIDLKDDYGNTPLWRAAFDARGDFTIVKLLTSHGASPNTKNESDRSPLDFAEQIGDQKLVAALREYS